MSGVGEVRRRGDKASRLPCSVAALCYAEPQPLWVLRLMLAAMVVMWAWRSFVKLRRLARRDGGRGLDASTTPVLRAFTYMYGPGS